MQKHVNVVAQPDPQTVFIRDFAIRSTVNTALVMPVKIYAGSGDIALFFILHYTFGHRNTPP
jgi:hypothetical protein